MNVGLGAGPLTGSLPGSGDLSGHSGGLGGLSDGEDFELPMLEHTTALSDGCVPDRHTALSPAGRGKQAYCSRSHSSWMS